MWRIIGLIGLAGIGFILFQAMAENRPAHAPEPAVAAITKIEKPEPTPAQKAEAARFARDVVAVRQLRSSMNNPNSFQLEEALRMDDGTLCLTYRATNAFNALMAGRAVIDAKRIITSDDRDRLTGVWNKLCANRSGADITHIRRAL